MFPSQFLIFPVPPPLFLIRTYICPSSVVAHQPHVIHNYLDHLRQGHPLALDRYLHNVPDRNPVQWGMLHTHHPAAHILLLYPTAYHTSSRNSPPSPHRHNGITCILFAVQDCPEACPIWRWRLFGLGIA